MCPSNKKVNNIDEPTEVINDVFVVTSDSHKNDTFVRQITINGHKISMLVDTGSARTIIDSETANNCNIKLKKTLSNIFDYTGNKIDVLGSALVELKYGDFCSSISVLIVKRGKNINGRDVLNQLTDNFVLNIDTYGAELTLKDSSKPVFL